MQRFLTILQNYLNQINMPNLRWTDIVEILILTFLIYHILLWIKNTRAWSLLKGLLVIGAFVALAALFNMSTILWIVQHVTGLAVTAVVILLQPELRSAMEELGQTNILSSLFNLDNQRTPEGRFSDKTISEIIRATMQMSRVRTGALIVIEQTTPLQEYARTGIDMDAYAFARRRSDHPQEPRGRRHMLSASVREPDGQETWHKAQGRRRHLGGDGFSDHHCIGGDGRYQSRLPRIADPGRQ